MVLSKIKFSVTFAYELGSLLSSDFFLCVCNICVEYFNQLMGFNSKHSKFAAAACQNMC